jgi:hypothetical protein
VTAFLFRQTGEHVARGWEMWPQLFWLNLLVAVVNTFAAATIMTTSPELVANWFPLAVMSVGFAFAFAAGIVHGRRKRKENS